MATQEDTGGGAPLRRFGIEAEDLAQIRASLLVGLACFGELERIRAMAGDDDIPEHLRPIDQSGDPAEITNFAAALFAIDAIKEAWLEDRSMSTHLAAAGK